MMDSPVLSLFPGLDALGLGFEQEGFCVVRGPELIWGRDIRDFHPPAGVFHGVIGGPPCPEHSPLRYLIAATGLHSRHGDLIPEFERVVAEAQPDWFLMEEGPLAPDAVVPGYGVHGFFLCPTWLGQEQSRKRKFSFGLRGHEPMDLRRWIGYAGFGPMVPEPAVLVSSPPNNTPEAKGMRPRQPAVTHHADPYLVAIGGSGKVKAGTVLAGHDAAPGQRDKGKSQRSIAEMLRLQGLPETMLDESPLTVQGKRSLVGNAVHLGVARELAKAVREARR